MTNARLPLHCHPERSEGSVPAALFDREKDSSSLSSSE